jgi:PAS domain S-box-containing protein
MNALPKTALVVEDDDATMELETRVLRRMGMKVRSASTNADAILALNRELFSVVLLDHKLPDGLSWPVLDAALDGSVRTPVIIVTAVGDERVAAEAIHRGAVDYVVKCFNFWDQLPLLIERAIKLAEAQQAHAHLASIVESSPDAIVSMAPDGTILSWNAAATLLCGNSPEEAIGANFSILSACGISHDFPTLLARLNRGEIVSSLESVRVGRDGRPITLSLIISPLKERGKVIGLSMIGRTYSERKARQLAQEASDAKEAFLANLSHEIRTPMNAILGLNAQMQQTSMTVNQSQYTANIGTAAKNLLALINNILPRPE